MNDFFPMTTHLVSTYLETVTLIAFPLIIIYNKTMYLIIWKAAFKNFGVIKLVVCFVLVYKGALLWE